MGDAPSRPVPSTEVRFDLSAVRVREGWAFEVVGENVRAFEQAFAFVDPLSAEQFDSSVAAETFAESQLRICLAPPTPNEAENREYSEHLFAKVAGPTGRADQNDESEDQATHDEEASGEYVVEHDPELESLVPTSRARRRLLASLSGWGLDLAVALYYELNAQQSEGPTPGEWRTNGLEWSVRLHLLAKEFELSERAQLLLAGSHIQMFAEHLGQNFHLSPRAAVALATAGTGWARNAVGENQSLSAVTIRQMIDAGATSFNIDWLIAEHASEAALLIRRAPQVLWNSKSARPSRAAKLPEQVREALLDAARHDDPTVRAWVPRVSRSAGTLLEHDQVHKVRQEVGRYTKDPSILMRLAKDESWVVRRWIAANRATPADALADLLLDRTKSVREAAERPHVPE